MNRLAGMGINSDEVRARILEVAEKQFRRIGYHKTSVADIASELGMSRANVYRFFPSKDAINESVCSRLADAVAEIALTIAHTKAPALERLGDILTAVHRHNKKILIEEKPMHDLMAAAAQGNRPVIKAYIEQIESILEKIIRDGNEAREFYVEDPARTARAIKTAFISFFHPILIEQCVQRGEDTEARLHDQIRFFEKALGKIAGCESVNP
jgi:AcrR family transcriptional regulator